MAKSLESKLSAGGFIEIKPMGKPRLTRRDSWKNKDGTFKRKCVNDWYTFKDTVREYVEPQQPERFNSLDITYYIAMPKSWSATKREEKNNTLHDSRPDIDNLDKAFLDSVLKDDSKIARLSAVKVWAHTGAICYNFTDA